MNGNKSNKNKGYNWYKYDWGIVVYKIKRIPIIHVVVQL